jgi:murein L,D-transpeptidase YafK
LNTFGQEDYSTGKWARAFSGIAVVAVLFSFFIDRAMAEPKIPWQIIAMEGKSATALVVEKKTQTLYVYSIEGDDIRIRKMACSTGKVHGDKKKGDDMRTPEGVYFFQGKLKGKKMARDYGAMAFQLDYPNSLDDPTSGKEKPVLLHGTNKELKPMDTAGSIAVENKNILDIEREISLDDTPVIITEEMGKCPAEDGKNTKDIVEGLDRLLAGWVKSMSEGTYHEILSHYSSDYMPEMGWWNTWRSVRQDSVSHGTHLVCSVSARSYFRDSEVYVALFRMTVASGQGVKDMGMKKLYIRSEKNGYKIVGDEFKKQSSDDSLMKNPLIGASKSLCAGVKQEYKDNEKQDVLTTLDEWVIAWSSGDIDRYGEFYADGFTSSGMNKKGWLEKKRKLSSINKNIEISIEKTVVELKKDKARARFKENYRSSGHSSKGLKTLVLVKKGSSWKILSETWVKK